MAKIDTALEKFKRQYGNKVSVLQTASDVTGLLSSSRNREIQRALLRGARVFALPIHYGKGMFEKWQIDKNGKIARDKNGKPIIKMGPKQIVAALVCSPKARNIGSDELLVEGETSMEGIRKSDALAVFQHLKINPARDAYVLFIRKPDRIKSAVAEFSSNLTGILTQGKRWQQRVRLTKIPLDARFFEKLVGGIAAQTHPLVIGKSTARILQGPLQDQFLRSKIVPAIERATQKGKTMRKK